MCIELLLQTSPRYCNRTVFRVVPVVVYPERIDLHVVNRVVLPEPHIGLQLERPGPIRGGQFSDWNMMVKEKVKTYVPVYVPVVNVTSTY